MRPTRLTDNYCERPAGRLEQNTFLGSGRVRRVEARGVETASEPNAGDAAAVI